MSVKGRQAWILVVSLALAPAAAAYKDDVGYARLKSRLGDAMPTGRGVTVAQVETALREDRPDNARAYLPDRQHRGLAGLVFIESLRGAHEVSKHATGVANKFYGRQRSMAPGIETVWLYEAEDFLGRLARWRRPGDAVFGSTARVWNHSWVANAGQHAGHLLRQLDAVAQAENWLVICGINNKGANQPLLASAFNVISVGRSNGGHPRGAAWVDSVYHSGRARPHIVAPMTTTSAATPLVSSAAALLMEVAPDADTRSALVIKAALLAGARRRFGELGRQLPGYRERAAQRAANGVDRRFGAGQLDVDFAHRIVTGSRVDGSEDPADAAAIEQFGFDYEPGFGHANRAAHYAFTAPADGHFVAALVWPVDVRLTPVDARVFVHDLNVRLVDDRERVVFASAGKADNDEHIYAAVEANRRYRLTVETAERAAGFVTPYALAWRFAADE